MASTRLAVGTAINTRDFSLFARACRKAAPEVAVELRTSLRAAGELVASDARSRSSWSHRIPGSIKVRTSGATVSVIAGGHAAPDAVPYEHRGLDGTFRHPLFGNRELWFNQQARPFLTPALRANIEPAMVMVVEALDKAIATAVI